MNQPTPNRKQNFWMIKFAPFRTSWEEIIRLGTFTLRGVRSPAARKNLEAMRIGDPVLFYRSQQDQAIVGLMQVAREAYPDPTSQDPKWLTCDFVPVKTITPVTLESIRATSDLCDLPLLRQPRLSVMRVSADEFRHLTFIKHGNQI